MDVPTPRELQVLRLFAPGKSTKEVAAEVGIAFRTAGLLGQLIYVGWRFMTEFEGSRPKLK